VPASAETGLFAFPDRPVFTRLGTEEGDAGGPLGFTWRFLLCPRLLPSLASLPAPEACKRWVGAHWGSLLAYLASTVDRLPWAWLTDRRRLLLLWPLGQVLPVLAHLFQNNH
jgi:hypothetical protein